MLHFRPRNTFYSASVVKEVETEKVMKGAIRSNSSPRYYNGLTVRDNVNHTISIERGSLETLDVNAFPLSMTARSLIRGSGIVSMILQLQYYGHVYRQASHWKHHRCPSIPRQQDVPRAIRAFSSRRARWPRTRGRWSARFRHDGSSLPRAEAAEREPRRGNHRNKTQTMWANPPDMSALSYTETLGASVLTAVTVTSAVPRIEEMRARSSSKKTIARIARRAFHTFRLFDNQPSAYQKRELIDETTGSTIGFFADTLRSDRDTRNAYNMDTTHWERE